jgi:hypothetical protein
MGRADGSSCSCNAQQPDPNDRRRDQASMCCLRNIHTLGAGGNSCAHGRCAS